MVLTNYSLFLLGLGSSIAAHGAAGRGFPRFYSPFRTIDGSQAGAMFHAITTAGFPGGFGTDLSQATYDLHPCFC